jgi:F-type H+-transporting ATPase subunit gamma
MATLREIKRRIGSVKSTQQITKAMKMVAAAKLRKTQSQLLAARPYSKKLGHILENAASLKSKDNPFLYERKVKNSCFVLITSDKGLCGSFNSNVIRRTIDEIRASDSPKDHLIVIGRKGYDYFNRLELSIRKHYTDFLNHMEFKHAKHIVSYLTKSFLDQRFDKINIVYQEFKSPVVQNIVVEQLLPIPSFDKTVKPSGLLFDPNPEKILKELIPLHLNYHLWRILLESFAAEQGARMTAMEAATDNAGDMIKSLVLYYNKARQAAITKELSEIVGGAEALNA